MVARHNSAFSGFLCYKCRAVCPDISSEDALRRHVLCRRVRDVHFLAQKSIGNSGDFLLSLDSCSSVIPREVGSINSRSFSQRGSARFVDHLF